MTLINYLSRVHFADGVLEVALGSELELHNFRNALFVSEPRVVNRDFTERVLSGLPSFVQATTESNPRSTSRISQSLKKCRADVLIAFGSSRALLVADACCKKLRRERNNSYASPELICIPGVDGVPTMSSAAFNEGNRTSASFRGEGIQATAVIFDPTVILGESVERTASAVATTMARCLSAHLSMGYNPPAEGIAADGFRRIVSNLPALLTDDTLEMRRELMAASLNGTLALQKISGIAAELCDVLVESSTRPLDEGALMRLLIAIEAELMDQTLTADDALEIRTVFGIPQNLSLSQWLKPLLSKLPLPQSFDAMGIHQDQLANAANEIVSRRVMKVPSAPQLCEMLNTVELTNA